MNWKIRVIKHWLKNKNNVSIFELMRVIIDFPYTTKGRLRTYKIKDEDEYKKIDLKKFKNSLYIPKEYSINSFYLTLEEIFNKNHWHNYEIEETTVNKGDNVLDCGAAEGLFTMVVKERANKVYAIEPLEDFYRALLKTYGNSKNVKIINGALSFASGEMYFKKDFLSSKITEEITENKVNVYTIDELFYNNGIKIDYIKADLEGEELNMLKGAVNTIKKYKPKLAITTYHNSDDAKKLYNFIKEIEPSYNIKLKGIQAKRGCYMMLHGWINKI